MQNHRFLCIFASKMTNKTKATIQKTKDQHPLFNIGERVEREGLVVIDNVTSQPLDGEPYISPYAIIALCQQGVCAVRVRFEACGVSCPRYDYHEKGTRGQVQEDIC